jgi:hypothetical protein
MIRLVFNLVILTYIVVFFVMAIMSFHDNTVACHLLSWQDNQHSVRSRHCSTTNLHLSFIRSYNLIFEVHFCVHFLSWRGGCALVIKNSEMSWYCDPPGTRNAVK